MAKGNSISKAQWYANRLRAMSAGEIVHRFAELAKKRGAGKRENLYPQSVGGTIGGAAGQ